MKFTTHTFSKKMPPVDCAIFTLHDRPEPERIIGEGMSVALHTFSAPPRATGVAILTAAGTVYVGVALCSSLDQYVRKVGYAKALGRAAKALKHGEKSCTVGLSRASLEDPFLPDVEPRVILDLIRGAITVAREKHEVNARG